MSETRTQTGGISIEGSANVGGDMVAGNKIVEAAAPPAVSLHQLPAPPSDFTGREKELAELMATVEKDGAIITGIRGLGGIGKTALALKLADAIKDRYPDAQFFVNLRGASDKPMSAAEAMAHVIRAYYPASKLPDDESELQALYRSVLHKQCAIIVLDDARDAQQVTPLLPPTCCLLLITSRQHFQVPGLHATDLEQLPPEDARKLLIEIAPRLTDVILSHGDATQSRDSAESERSLRAEAKNLSSTITEIPRPFVTRNDTVEAADLIAHLCGYLPLALHLAGSSLAERIDLSPHDYIRRLSDTQQRLKLTGVDASLQLSYDLLAPELRSQWCQLAVFPADFDRIAATYVWSGSYQDEAEDKAQDALSELFKYSLVNYTAYDSDYGRYSLHDLARLFADARLSNEEPTAALRRHAEHYRNVLSACDDLYLEGGESITRGLGSFDQEWPNIQAGQAWAASHAKDDDEAAQSYSDYPNAGTYVLDLRQHPRERIRWLEDALGAARYMKRHDYESADLNNLGLAYADLGETRRAIEFYEQALIIIREISAASHSEAERTVARRGEASALMNTGNAYADLGEFRHAIEYHDQALVIFREIGDRRGEANALMNTGNAYNCLGEFRHAIEYHDQALVIFREIGDRHSEGKALSNLGNAYYSLGETRRAIEFYEQTLSIDREIGDRRGEGADLGNLGNAYSDLGETRKAIEFCEQALTIDREISDRRGEGATLGNLGLAYRALGETRKAIDFYEQALTIDREISDRRGEGATLGNLGSAYRALGETRQAIEYHKQALKVMQGIGDRRAEGSIAGNLGLAYSDLGETRQAIEFYEQHVKIAREIGDRRGEGTALWNMSLALDKLGEREKAIVCAEAALKIREAIEDPHAGMVRQALAKWKNGGQSSVVSRQPSAVSGRKKKRKLRK